MLEVKKKQRDERNWELKWLDSFARGDRKIGMTPVDVRDCGEHVTKALRENVDLLATPSVTRKAKYAFLLFTISVFLSKQRQRRMK